MSSEICFVSRLLRSASFRTSSATTAKPRPCSPARAASIASIQRQQVGLLRNVVDRLDDGTDLVAELAKFLDARARLGHDILDLRHTSDRFANRLSAVLRRSLGLLARCSDRVRIGGDVLDAFGHVAGRRAGGQDLVCLIGRAAGDAVDCCCQLAYGHVCLLSRATGVLGAGGDRLDGLKDIADCVVGLAGCRLDGSRCFGDSSSGRLHLGNQLT